ncbi:MAG: PaaI family thioesterase [Halioglobus sp.]|nr:PaaI family thioesterase [Halioglobus sp.]
MQDQNIIDALNIDAPIFIQMLGGKARAIDHESQSCTFEFNISKDFCHSVDVVQGGFITAMLDAAMSHAIFAHHDRDTITGVSSLEIKTSFLEPTRAGRLRAVGKILKYTYKTAFLEGHLYDANNLLTATSSSVAKLVRAKG